jgi:ribosome-associated protein
VSDPRVPDDALVLSFVRSGGPGGQHVNKVASAVQLRVLLGRTTLPEPVKSRLRKLAGSRLSGADEILIFADRHRSQLRNREDALARWNALLTEASQTPRRRVATQPSRRQKQTRLDDKKRQGDTKRMRRRPPLD